MTLSLPGVLAGFTTTGMYLCIESDQTSQVTETAVWLRQVSGVSAAAPGTPVNNAAPVAATTAARAVRAMLPNEIVIVEMYSDTPVGMTHPQQFLRAPHPGRYTQRVTMNLVPGPTPE